MPPTQRGELRLERSIIPDAADRVRLAQRFSGEGVRVVVTHEASLLARIHVVAGALDFLGARGEARAPASFVLSIPPRSVVPMRFSSAEIASDGLGAIGPLAPGAAAIFEDEPSLDLSPALAALDRPKLALLDADRGAPPRLERARALLHEHIDVRAPIRAAAEGARVSTDALARGFRRFFHITPKQYVHRARVFDAVIRLLIGAPIADVAFMIGFNDMSRFYSQFRRIVGATPGDYARAGKRQDRARGRAP